METENLAAIDLGSNSCRLTIADRNGNFLYRDSVATKLGEGLYQSGKFSDKSVERGVTALSSFAKAMKQYNVGVYRAIATAACRMASNAPEFLEAVKKQTGLTLEVIDAYEEARLNLVGAVQNADSSKDLALVFDIGGGSTEISLAEYKSQLKIRHTISVPWGARNAAEAFSLIDYNDESAERLQAEIGRYTQAFKQDTDFERLKDNCSLIATSSTPLRLAALLENNGSYDRARYDGAVLPTSDLTALIDRVCKMSLEERCRSPYIGDNRAPIFVAGVLVFKTIYKSFEASNVRASYKGAQDGIIAELMNTSCTSAQ